MPELSTFVVATVDAASQSALSAMAAYFAELDATFPTGFDPGPDWQNEVHTMGPPGGAFLVLLSPSGDVAACGGLQSLGDRVVEIKRMWVAPGVAWSWPGATRADGTGATGRRSGTPPRGAGHERHAGTGDRHVSQGRLHIDRPLQRQPLRPTLVRQGPAGHRGRYALTLPPIGERPTCNVGTPAIVSLATSKQDGLPGRIDARGGRQ